MAAGWQAQAHVLRRESDFASVIVVRKTRPMVLIVPDLRLGRSGARQTGAAALFAATCHRENRRPGQDQERRDPLRVPSQLSCPNLNHRRPDAPVRCCPGCGEVVNADIRRPDCSREEHARNRRLRNAYCVNCGEELIARR